MAISRGKPRSPVIRADRKPLLLSRSELAEAHFFLNSRPFSLDNYPMSKMIYDTDPAQTVVLKCSRQVSKSTTIANIILANSILLPQDPTQQNATASGFRTLYLSPSVDQTNEFSSVRLAPVMEESPFIKNYYLTNKLKNNIGFKSFLNKATVKLKYVGPDPKGIRGISFDAMMLDEAQDLNTGSIDIATYGNTTSLYKWIWVAGTPQRKIGTLADYWFKSTMNEWIVKCSGCNKHNMLLEANIGLKGVICAKCGKLLNVREGRWECTNPQARQELSVSEGFRFCKLNFVDAPFIDWEKDVLFPYKNETNIAHFYNESLGLEYDDGSGLITKEQIKACCDSNYLNPEPLQTVDVLHRSRPSFMGIDWGPPDSTKSYTLVVIIQVDEYRRPVIKFLKRYEGAEADFANLHKEIPKLVEHWKVRIIGADRGMGEASNSELRDRCPHTKVVEFYHNSTMKESLTWKNDGKYFLVNRGKFLRQFFKLITKRNIVFPNYNSIEHPYVDDMTAIVPVYDELKNITSYSNSMPDDTVHAILFGMLATHLSGTIIKHLIPGV